MGEGREGQLEGARERLCQWVTMKIGPDRDIFFVLKIFILVLMWEAPINFYEEVNRSEYAK